MAQRTIRCENCGVNLPLQEGQKVVECEYCGTHTAIPPDFWKAPEQTERNDASRLHVPVQPAPPAANKNRASVLVVVGLVAALSVGGAVFSIVMKGAGGMQGSHHVGHVNAKAVTPSFEDADGIATARNAERMVLDRWNANARTGIIYLNDVEADGTLDLHGDDAGSMSITFHDLTGLDAVLPGQTDIEGAAYHVGISAHFVGGGESDLTVTTAEDMVYIEEWPGCDLQTLWKEATAAGYPDRGFATIRFPEVPHYLSRDNFRDNLGWEDDGEALQEKFDGIEWDETPWHSFYFYIANFDPEGKLPKYFSMSDCKPIDEDAILKREIEKLRGWGDVEPSAGSE